jgi:hypothetical protein
LGYNAGQIAKICTRCGVIFEKFVYTGVVKSQNLTGLLVIEITKSDAGAAGYSGLKAGVRGDDMAKAEASLPETRLRTFLW